MNITTAPPSVPPHKTFAELTAEYEANPTYANSVRVQPCDCWRRGYHGTPGDPGELQHPEEYVDGAIARSDAENDR